MGKYVLLIVLGGAGIYALSQQQSTVRTAEHRSERSEEVLARQAARTGFNAVRAKTRTKAQETCADELVTAVGSISGTYETDGSNRGTYQARLEEVSSLDFAYRIYAEGQYEEETVTLDQIVRRDGSRAGILYGTTGNGKLKQTTASGSEGFGSAPQVRGIGPLATDLDGDGEREVPYVRKSNQKIEMIDSDAENRGDAQVLVPSSTSDAAPADSKTRLATGTWQNNQKSVFYANEDHETIYKTWWDGGGSPNIEEVRRPPNGAQAILGVDDIDGDAAKELVFADASQHVRYIEQPGGTVQKLENGGVGSSEGIGAGGLVDLNGDGTASAVFVNGSNNLRVVDADGTDRTITLDDGSDDGAAKASPTALDLDSDGELEIAYLRAESDSGPDIEFVNSDGSNIRPLCGVSVEKAAGLQSYE